MIQNSYCLIHIPVIMDSSEQSLDNKDQNNTLKTVRIGGSLGYQVLQSNTEKASAGEVLMRTTEQILRCCSLIYLCRN